MTDRDHIAAMARGSGAGGRPRRGSGLAPKLASTRVEAGCRGGRSPERLGGQYD